MQNPTPADHMFRTFQIQKFDTKRLVPAVNMSVDVNASRLMELRKKANEKLPKERRLTVTHIVLKAASDVLMEFPTLYSSFNGRRIVPNPELVLNVPVDVENHVEYLVLRQPNRMSLTQLAAASYGELDNIHRGEGEFRQFVARIARVPFFIRKLAMLIPGQDIRFLRKYYGNFVISNFGALGVDRGVLASAQPMIAVLCMGKIADRPVPDADKGYRFQPSLPLTMTFDHRPVDGGYVGRYLSALKALLEVPDRLFESAL